ncbi:MAG: polysaccharide deacetylase family protein [Bacteroidota bacterium]
MKIILSLLLLSLFVIVNAQEKEICVSVDDLPFVGYGVNNPDALRSMTNQLLESFITHEVPAIGFVNEKKLYFYERDKIKKSQVDLLKVWLNNGFELGNHTYSHYSYHHTPFTTYTEDILKGEKVSKPLSEQYSLPYRYFRHPFLRVGLRKTHHDSLTTFLHQHQYQEAPVSVDNEDYLFAKAYAIAARKKDQALMKKIGNDYVNYMMEKLAYFEGRSEALLGRNIRQILLIHANKINADYFALLAERIKAKGYTFVSMERALEDPAYKTEITKYGNYGISWLDRWALSKGVPGEFFKDDPKSPDYIYKMTQ